MKSWALGLVVLVGMGCSKPEPPPKVGTTTEVIGDLSTFISWIEKPGPLNMRISACEYMEKLGPKAKEALPALEKAVKSGPPELREAAQKAITSIKAGP